MKYVAGALGLVLLGLVAAVVWIYAGFYNIAASQPHVFLTRWIFHTGLRESVEFYARNVKPPPLDDPSLVWRGMGHYRTACESCHGAPGIAPEPMTAGMLPAAPDLSRAVPHWKPRELYWIVKHGIKFTGMPAWGPVAREDELWAMVAFLLALPGMSPETYRAMLDLPDVPEDLGRTIALSGDLGSGNACYRCHGIDGQGGGEGAFPRLAGLSADYMVHALTRYAEGVRASGIMATVAADLSQAERRAIAGYYANRRAPYPPPPSADPQLVRAGAILSAQGDPAGGVVACSGCHGEAGIGTEIAPRLAGQYANYLALQLTLWKTGAWGFPAPTNPMPNIAAAMTDEQIAAAAAYFASVRPEVVTGSAE